MREILFRGKRQDNGAWVEGAFCPKDCDTPFGEMVDRPSIIKLGDPFSGFWFRVVPDTIGQFTGLTDKNGKKIFDGDVVESFDMFGRVDGCGIVHWDDTFCAWHMGDCKAMYGNSIASYEIIGNIHDNSESVEG